MKTEAVELAVAGYAMKTSWGAAFAGVVAWMTSSVGMGLLSLCVAVIGTAVGVWFKHKADVRAEALHKMRLEYMQRGKNPVTDFSGLGEDD